MNDGHHAYDRVLELARQPPSSSDVDDATSPSHSSPYLLMTLRDSIEYVVKGYMRRSFWDAPTLGIQNMTMSKWLTKVPWRANQMTRMMGRNSGNHDERHVLQAIIDPMPNIELQADDYMVHQNELAETSEILQRAWRRLSKELHWFGIFHRLPESMELLAYTFCANADKLMEPYQKRSQREKKSTRQQFEGLIASVFVELTESERRLYCKTLQSEINST